MPLPSDSYSAHDLLTERLRDLLAECDLVIDTAPFGAVELLRSVVGWSSNWK